MNIIELTDKNYEKIITENDKPMFVDFYSELCAPCQTLLSFLPTIAKEAEKNNVIVLKCNVSKNPLISKKYMIESIPFTCIIDENKKIQYPNYGLNDISYYINLIEKFNLNNKNFFNRIIDFFK